MLEKETTLFKASQDKPYLRTNIPKLLADIMDLKEGDEIVWRVDVPSDEVSVTLEKKEGDPSD
jgi:hypothetical protein